MTVIGQGVEICTSTTRPNNAVVGTVIYETDTASYRWCTSDTPSIVWTGMIPVGTVQPFAGSVEPPGWLFCFGQSLNASTSPQYADLFSVLSTTYGGSGITAFSLPDLRGRAPFGKDNMGGSAINRITTAGSNINGAALNSNGGSQSMATHRHDVRIGLTDSNYAATGVNGAMGGSGYPNAGVWNYASGVWSGAALATNVTTVRQPGGTAVSGTAGLYSSTGNTDLPASIQNHQNMPPTIILNYIIKF